MTYSISKILPVLAVSLGLLGSAGGAFAQDDHMAATSDKGAMASDHMAMDHMATDKMATDKMAMKPMKKSAMKHSAMKHAMKSDHMAATGVMAADKPMAPK